MLDTPYEVWIQIASFLPGDALWNLRGLNHTLYDIAMDNRYRRIEIPLKFQDIELYGTNFLGFRDERIAPRVREIAFCTTKTRFPPKMRPSSLAKRVQIMKQRMQNSFVGGTKLVHDTIAKFPNINSLSIEFSWIEKKELKECLPLFCVSLQAAANNLRILDLSMPFERLTDIIPPSLFLPCLESLSILLFSLTITPCDRSDFKPITVELLIPFINRHRMTLTSLHLQSPGCQAAACLRLCSSYGPSIGFSISPLFKGVDQIVHLRSLSVSISEATQSNPIYYFMKRHSETIRKLHISFHEPALQSAESYIGQLNGISLPNLSTLTINYDTPLYFPEIQDHDLLATTDVVHRFSLSLTSLSLLNTGYSRDGIFALLDPPAKMDVGFSMLSFLSIRIQSLTPEILDLFACCLPSLYELQLRVLEWPYELSNNFKTYEYEFSAEMLNREYGHWGLKHFNISCQNGGEIHSALVSCAIVRAIPSLLTFCGSERAQYIPQVPNIDGSSSFISLIGYHDYLRKVL